MKKNIFTKDNLMFFIILNLGLIFTAVGIAIFKTPNHFAFGGTSGLSIILSTLFPKWNVGAFMWIVNAALVVLGFFFLGIRSMGWTVYSSFALSFYVSACEAIYPLSSPLTHDVFLELCFAVILPAVGAAMVFNVGASTGGTDIVAMIVTKYHNVSPGKMIMYADCGIIASSLLINFNIEGLMYGYVMMGVVSFTVDFVLTGKKQSAQLFIFTEKYDQVAEQITQEVDRGVTVVDCHGWYTGQAKKMLVIVVRKNEAIDVLKIAKRVDPDVFMTMNTVMGVFGKGFEEVKGVK